MFSGSEHFGDFSLGWKSGVPQAMSKDSEEAFCGGPTNEM